LDQYKLKVFWGNGSGERIPAWAIRTVQDERSAIFNAQVWSPENPYQWKNPAPDLSDFHPFIYEAHVGMATEEFKVGSFDEFRKRVLPRVVDGGYNTLQLMAIQEHPYYGSFGYHVKNELEGLGMYAGDPGQFFHTGSRREHVAWDSLCYDYGKNEVLHFLLSNIHFWLEEYKFDGFRFDGVTSTLFYDHGLGRDFS
ncbi:MAG: 1,4-alpha-glucan-branching enzyme, partial [Bacteroidales bacterium]